MLADRLIALVAICSVLAFLGVLLMWVPRVDLMIVTAVVVLLMLYDFYRELVRRPKE